MKVLTYTIDDPTFKKAEKNEKIAEHAIKNVMKIFSGISHSVRVNKEDLSRALSDGFEDVHVSSDGMTRDTIIRFRFKKDDTN